MLQHTPTHYNILYRFPTLMHVYIGTYIHIYNIYIYKILKKPPPEKQRRYFQDKILQGGKLRAKFPAGISDGILRTAK